MRAAIAALQTSRPMVELLPSIYQEDLVSLQWLSAFDQVLTPLVTSIDCFSSYLDTELAPDDFLAWLGTWVGVGVSEDWTRQRRQKLVAEAVELFALRGTVEGMQRFLELAVGFPCEVIEGGGVHASSTPNAELPGTDVPAFVVRFNAPTPTDEAVKTRINAVVEEQRPAHLPCVVEFTGSGPTTKSATTGAAPSGTGTKRKTDD
jgi:phage tail-like protein